MALLSEKALTASLARMEAYQKADYTDNNQRETYEIEFGDMVPERSALVGIEVQKEEKDEGSEASCRKIDLSHTTAFSMDTTNGINCTYEETCKRKVNKSYKRARLPVDVHHRHVTWSVRTWRIKVSVSNKNVP